MEENDPFTPYVVQEGRSSYPLGRVDLLDPLSLTPWPGRWFLNPSRELSLQEALFFDLETVLLPPPFGTVPFLYGFGFYEGSTFKVLQFFLQEPERERELLEEIGSFLGFMKERGKLSLVTFNGRRFDEPLLQERRALQGFADPLPEFLSLDLYPVCRKVFRYASETFRLATLSERFLGHSRDEEPSFRGEITPRYRRFLIDGDETWIEPIREHNRWDVLDTMALSLWILQRGLEPQRVTNPDIALGMGGFFAERHKKAEAFLSLRRAAELFEEECVDGGNEEKLSVLRKHLKRIES